MSEHQPTHHYSLDKLPVRLEGASNYNTWCSYVRAALMGQDIEGHITGDTPAPDLAAANDKKAVAEWRKRDNKARSIIMLGVAPSLLNHISATGLTAKDMWDILAVQCRRRDTASQMSLVQQLFTTRLTGADNVDSHISAMSDIRNQLVDIGRPIDDSLAAIALLLSAPSEVPQWEMFLRSQSASLTSPTWDSASSAMRAEASLQQQRERIAALSNTPTVGAYAAQHKQGSKQADGAQRGGSLFCTNCNKKGHIVDGCWKKFPHLKEQYHQQHHIKGYFVTIEEQSANSALLAQVAPTSSSTTVGQWHVDSGASAHLSGTRAWFSELHQCEPCTVTTANHGRVTCTQRGTVSLHTEQGVLTIDEVLFVPSIVVNLLSVSALLKVGLRVRFTERACTVRVTGLALVHAHVYQLDI